MTYSIPEGKHIPALSWKKINDVSDCKVLSIETRGDIIKVQPRAGSYFPYMRRCDVVYTDVIDLRGAEKHRNV